MPECHSEGEIEETADVDEDRELGRRWNGEGNKRGDQMWGEGGWEVRGLGKRRENGRGVLCDKLEACNRVGSWENMGVILAETPSIRGSGEDKEETEVTPS